MNRGKWFFCTPGRAGMSPGQPMGLPPLQTSPGFTVTSIPQCASARGSPAGVLPAPPHLPPAGRGPQGPGRAMWVWLRCEHNSVAVFTGGHLQRFSATVLTECTSWRQDITSRRNLGCLIGIRGLCTSHEAPPSPLPPNNTPHPRGLWAASSSRQASLTS